MRQKPTLLYRRLPRAVKRAGGVTNGRPAATSGSAAGGPTQHERRLPEPRRDQRERHRCPPNPLPQPVFRPGGSHSLAVGRALSRLARAFCAPPAGLGLDRRSPPSRYTFFPPGRAGFPVPARAQRSGAGAFFPSPLGGGGEGKGAASILARLSPPRGERKQCLAARQRRSGSLAATPHQPPH